jgi:hypothetical protein
MPEDTPLESLTEHVETLRSSELLDQGTWRAPPSWLSGFSARPNMDGTSLPDPVLDRRCPQCRRIYPRTTDFFYQRPGNGAWEYCQGEGTQNCHARYWASRGSGRRSGLQRVGLEIEFVGDRHRVLIEALNRGLSVQTREYTHEVVDYWKIVTDASIVDGGELVSPPLTRDELERQVPVACAALTAAGATVAARCGMHVHLEVRGFRGPQLRRAWVAWFANQGLINEYVSPSRRDGQWCRLVTQADLDYLLRRETGTARDVGRGLVNLNRYSVLNGQAYGRYGTIEVRLHQGTINVKKILAWHAFCRAIVDWAAASEDDDVVVPRMSHDALLDALAPHGLDDETRDFLRTRREEIALLEASRRQPHEEHEEHEESVRRDARRTRADYFELLPLTEYLGVQSPPWVSITTTAPPPASPLVSDPYGEYE